MKVFSSKDFNLKATLESGQIFRWHHGTDGFYYVIISDAILKLRQEKNKVKYNCTNPDFDVAWFLGLKYNYKEIISTIRKDEKIAAAIKHHYGLRILGQDLWECTASFICSAFSNIPRIRQCLEKVAAAFGNEIEFGGFKTFSFPRPQQINSFSKLKKCGLGYRAKYLFETAKIFANKNNGYSPHQLRKLGYAAAKEKLMKLPGVGSKVADCILLFSCGFFEAFPVDVWIGRAMEGIYSEKIASYKLNERVIAEFARAYFGNYAGYAQQFLYHHARTAQNSEL